MLEAGYWRAYHDFYRWGAILQGASTKETIGGMMRHLAYAGGWKKFEPVWDAVIRLRHVASFRPVLEAVLTGFGRHAAQARASIGMMPHAGLVAGHD